MERLLKELENKYSDCKFKIVKKDGKFIVLFNDEELEWDEEFNSMVRNKIIEFFGDEESENWIVGYDYLEIIENGDKTGYYDNLDSNTIEVINKEIKFLNLKLNLKLSIDEKNDECFKELITDKLFKKKEKNTNLFVITSSLS